ncbi:MAG: WD40 repeat domain-containing protein [Planctomycetes bacterium]|nr:WD40 repeat domain-containing protein [Planctomycetota bacterium]
MEQRLAAAALESLGRSLIVSDAKGGVTLLSARGRPLWTISSPKPLLHLTFIPSRRQVVASADFGLAGSLDDKGAWIWKDAPITNVGDLSITGDGATVLLACYSEGLHRYGDDGRSLGRLPTAQPCRHVAQSYSGDRILVAGLNPELVLLNRDGTELARRALDCPVTGLALSALGDTAVVSLASGTIMKWKITSKRSPNRGRETGSSAT